MKNRLKEIRIKKKLTLDDIEAKTGIKRGTYSNYENSKTEPKLEVWQKLADFFNVSVPYLQGFETQVPNRLRELRRSHGLTLKDTAEKVKEQEALIITADALAKYERGDREPKLEILQKLADFFKVSVPYLQGFDEHKSNRLKELRNRNHLTLKELGQNVGMANNTLSQYENGKRNPNDKVWQQLADYFEVSVPYLKGEIDTEYLEKLVELLMLLSFPKIVISYGDTDIDDDTKSYIGIEIIILISELLGYDSKDKFLEIYNKVIKLVNDTETIEYLQDFKNVVIQLMPKAKGTIKNLLNAYENL